MIKKGIIISALLFCIRFTILSAPSHSIVSGVVTSSNGNPVEFVVVYVDNNLLTTTNEKGEYILELPSGEHKLYFTHLNYENAEQIVSIDENRTKKYNVVLKENEQILSAIIINGKSTKKEIETKGFAVNVIETQKIATQSIQTNELLDRTAGVRIRQDGGMGSRVNYNINGLSGNAIKMFIDGVPISNYGSSFSLNSIPPALIERIEVYKGVVPGYLSEDALGGAINIVLKQHRKKSFTTSYSYGSFNTHQWNATGNYSWKNGLTLEGSAFYNYSDNNYEVWGKDIFFRSYDGSIIESNNKRVKRFHDAYESLGGKFNIGFTNVKWADQFMIGVVHSQGRNDIQNGVTMQLVYGNRHNKRWSDVFTLVYSKKDLLVKGLTLKVDASYSHLKRQVIDTIGIRFDWNGAMKYPDGSYVQYTSGAEVGKQKTAELNTDYSSMIRASLGYYINDYHRLYANYMSNGFNRHVSDEYLALALQKLKNTRDLQKNIVAFTYEGLFCAEKLRTNLFYKYYFQKVISNESTQSGTDFYVTRKSKDIDNSGYGLTLSYALFPNFHILASGEKAIRLPNANEIFGNVADGSLLLPSFSLEPEKSLNANIGFNFGPYKVEKHCFNLNASFFYRDTKDMIRESYTSGNETSSQYKNLESVESTGIDAEFSYDYSDKINFRFNVSKFDVLFNTQYNEYGHIYNYYRMQICNEPSFKFNGNLTYFHKNLFQKGSLASITYNINYVNSFLRSWANVGSTNLDEVPAQTPMDLGGAYSFPRSKFIISIDAKNIFDQQIYDNFGLQKPGRAFYAKVTYKLL